MNYPNQLLECGPARLSHCCQQMMRNVRWGSHDQKARPNNMGGVLYVAWYKIQNITWRQLGFDHELCVLQFTAMCATEDPSWWIKYEATHFPFFLQQSLKYLGPICDMCNTVVLYGNSILYMFSTWKTQRRQILTRISGGYEFFMQTSFDSNCLKSWSSEVKVRCELSASDVHTRNWSAWGKVILTRQITKICFQFYASLQHFLSIVYTKAAYFVRSKFYSNSDCRKQQKFSQKELNAKEYIFDGENNKSPFFRIELSINHFHWKYMFSCSIVIWGELCIVFMCIAMW